MNRKTLPRDDPRREWTWIGGDLEASFDGSRYVDIRVRGNPSSGLYISKEALRGALALFNPIVVVKE